MLLHTLRYSLVQVFTAEKYLVITIYPFVDFHMNICPKATLWHIVYNKDQAMLNNMLHSIKGLMSIYFPIAEKGLQTRNGSKTQKYVMNFMEPFFMYS